MKRTPTQKIGTILDAFFEQNPILSQKLAETRLINSWISILGKGVSQYTESLFIRNRILYVRLTSSVLKNELLMCREKIIGNLNEHVGQNVIDEIRFI